MEDLPPANLISFSPLIMIIQANSPFPLVFSFRAFQLIYYNSIHKQVVLHRSKLHKVSFNSTSKLTAYNLEEKKDGKMHVHVPLFWLLQV